MPTIKRIKEALLGGSERKEYHYECTVCNAKFASEEPTVQTVACPQCGAHGVRERVSGTG